MLNFVAPHTKVHGRAGSQHYAFVVPKGGWLVTVSGTRNEWSQVFFGASVGWVLTKYLTDVTISPIRTRDTNRLEVPHTLLQALEYLQLEHPVRSRDDVIVAVDPVRGVLVRGRSWWSFTQWSSQFNS